MQNECDNITIPQCRKFRLAKGNPNPSPKTRFSPGISGNPGGKTGEAKRLEVMNAEAAMRIRERLLRATEARLVEMSSEEVMALIEPSMLKLITDSETRGLGSPMQSVDLSSTDGSMSPAPIDASKMSAETMRELLAARRVGNESDTD